jgi:tetratricopeptide (TPR) repeat protein
MTRLTLAIPAASLLLLSVFLPSSAQNFTDTPVMQVANSSSVPNQPAKTPMSSEDMARLLMVRKEYRQAEEIFYKLTVEQPKNAIYWNELGITKHKQDEFGAALKCYQKAAKLDGKYSDALNNAGTVLYEQKKYAKAIRSYRKAIAIRSDFAPFYLNLGFAYFNEKKYEDSIAAFRKALEIDPSSFDSSRSRSGTVVEDRSMGTDRGLFYYTLAKSYAEAGNIERCVLYLKKARDEGYKDMNAAKTDPSFAKIITDPSVQDAIEPKPVSENTQP